uniref:G-protein coupled receptors family 1 profile domain-containing protein n=1 Tax=Amphiprion percula TaxID=161767 RepID=A0A3P8TNI0_AMPPE
WGSAQEGHEPSWSLSMDTSFQLDTDYNHTYVDEHFYYVDNVDGFGITMAILYLVVCIVGLAGNSLVIVAILKLDKMSSSTTVYIFNLALADGLFMVGLPFIASQNFQNHWMFGDIACKAVMVLDGINQFTSVFCLTVMSIDRYMALAEPLRFARFRTPRCAKIVSAFLWLFSLLTILPMALHFSAVGGLCIPDLGILSTGKIHRCVRGGQVQWQPTGTEQSHGSYRYHGKTVFM